MTKTATYVRHLSDFNGEAVLYRVSPPLAYDWEERGRDFEFVVSSAIFAAFDTGRPETFLFPADENGEILDWMELPGSTGGVADPTVPLTRLGYTIE